MANTPNIDLVKPAGTDHALVSVLNSNSDKIDTFAGTTNAAIANVGTSTSLGTYSTESALITALEQLLANTPSNGVKQFQFGTSATFATFKNGLTYIGTLYKSGTNTTFTHVNIKAISGPDEIVGRRNSNGWDWQELALKSEASGVVKKGNIASGGTMTHNLNGYSAFVVCSRVAVSGTTTTAFVDQWGQIAYISNEPQYALSVSNGTLTITNNSSAYINYMIIS